MRRLCLVILLVVFGRAADARRYAYVLNQGNSSNASSSSVSVIELDTATVTATIPINFEPTAVAVQPDGLRVYVTSAASDSVQVIDALTNTVSATVWTGAGPSGIAVDPTGTHVYVAHRSEEYVAVFPTANPSAPQVNIPMGRLGGVLMAVDQDASLIFVGFNDGALGTIDTLTNTATINASAGLPNILGLAAYGYYPPGRGVIMCDGATAVLARSDGTGIRLTLVNQNHPWDVAVRLSGFSLPEVYVVEQAADRIRFIGPGTLFGTAGYSPTGIAYSDDEDLNANDQAFVVTNNSSDTAAIIKVDAGAAGTVVTVPVGENPTRVAAGPVLRAQFRILPSWLSFTYANLFAILKVIRITNIGGAVLTPTKPTIEGSSRFRVVSDECAGKKIPPGGSCNLTVSFSAAELGASYAATLSMGSIDPKVRAKLSLTAQYQKAK